MKLLLVMIFLCVAFCSTAQNQKYARERAEQDFGIYLKGRIVDQIKTLQLGDDSISRIQFYKYKILRPDSIVFYPMNWQIKSIDSIVKIAFYDAVNLMKKKRQFEFLIDQSGTYIPVIILYKTSPRTKLNERISIAPFEEVFDLQMDSDTKQPEGIIKMMSPFILRLPIKSNPYLPK